MSYSMQEKPKGKMLWKVLSWWDKYNERDCNLKEPVMPSFIKEKALQELKIE